MTDQAPRNAEDFCYRHPDRRSYVLCQRCLRTICPECQTPGAVGVTCPECMREQAKAQPARVKRAARSFQAANGTPVVTYTLLGLTSAVSLLAMVVPGITTWLMFYALWLYPQWTGVFQPWRLETVLLVHGGFLHLALNMLALWMIGRGLEPVLGRGRYLALYLISGLGGSVGVALIAPDQPVVGASGAIFGLLTALLVIGRHLGGDVRGILVVLGINLVIGFLPGFEVAWQAHIGGAIVGALVGFIYTRTRRPEQRRTQIVLLGAVVLGLLALLALPPVIYS